MLHRDVGRAGAGCLSCCCAMPWLHACTLCTGCLHVLSTWMPIRGCSCCTSHLTLPALIPLSCAKRACVHLCMCVGACACVYVCVGARIASQADFGRSPAP
eukprot:1517392-Alexandrium_andersonii.AAC.1